MSEPPRIVAIVPAAGRSRRMGRDKPALPVDGVPMLRRVLDAIRGGGVIRAVVVTRSDLVLPELGTPSPTIVLNDDPDAEMIDSVRLGMSAALDADGWLVCPGDAARLDADSVSRCVAGFLAQPRSLIVATHGGRRGHPLIVPRDLLGDVRSTLCDAGLNRLPRHHAGNVVEVPCAAAGVLSNLNRPRDLSS